MVAITSEPALLTQTLGDRLHEQTRLQMVPGVSAFFDQLRAAGVPVCVSGAGPTLLAFQLDGVSMPDPGDRWQVMRLGVAAYGVEIVGPVEGRNGSICSLVSPDGARSMAADRGAARELRADEVDAGWLADCDHLHVSGYALMVEPVRGAALRATKLARAERARISVDLASWSAIRDSGVEAFRDAVRAVAPDAVFATEEEERVVSRSVGGAAWILKRGARGCSFDGDEREALPVGQVIDSTGAGVALAPGWIVGGPDLALEAAARCVQHVGAMPRDD